MNFKINKMKKTILASLTGASLLTANNAAAFAGFLDVNVTEISQMILKISDAVSKEFIAYYENEQKKIQNEELKVQEMVLKLQAKQRAYERNAINPQACQNLVSNSAVLSSGGQSKSEVAKNVKGVLDKNVKNREHTTQLHERRLAAREFNCTAEDAEKGVFGCELNNVKRYSGGLDRNPSILSGSILQVRSDDQRNTGAVIVKDKIGSAEYKGVESAKNFLEAKYGVNPMGLLTKSANLSDDGANYNEYRKTYLNRKNTAKEIEYKYLAKYSEIENPSEDIKALWANPEVVSTLKSMNGPNYIKPTNPSEQEVLNYVVNRAFNKASSALSNLGTKGSEAQLMAIQAKIALEQLDALRDNNRLLATVILNQMNPISINELENMRKNAEQSGLNSGNR